MKNLFSKFLSSLVIVGLSHSISFAQCTGGQAQYVLSNSHLSAKLNTNGDLWFDGNNANYEVPLGSGAHAFFAGGLWFGGIDPGENLHLAAQTYGAASGNYDFFPGPIPFDGGADPELCEQFDRFFPIEKSDILALIADYNDNGIIDDPIPNDLLGWPATMNPFFEDVHGFELPFSPGGLAPFFDANSDGVYDPYDGDYPKVNGDHAVWWVFNDAGGFHGNSEAIPVRMEIQALAYVYDSGSEVIDNTTFYDFRMKYLGFEALENFHLGLWLDPDLGCWSDDFIGCVPEENLAYVYNADGFDENCNGLIGYGDEIPMVGVKKIRSSSLNFTDMVSFVYYFNENSGASPSQTDPTTDFEFYHYLSGLWRDATPFSKGGDGYAPFADPHPFAFDGSTVGGQPWTECTANSIPGDRRFLMNYGGEQLLPSSIHRMTFAVNWKPDVEHPCPDVDGLVNDLNTIADFDDAQVISSENAYQAPVALFDFEIMTGSASFDFTDQSYNAPTSWLWNFGGLLASTEQNPSFTFPFGGNFEVCLTVMNDAGENTFCQNIEVELPAPPTSDFTFSTDVLEVSFNDQSDNEPTSWEWDFGDTNSSNEQNPTHVYAGPGTYPVCLTTTNSLGSDTYCQEVTVELPPAPMTDFTYTVFPNGTAVAFSDNSLNDPTEWEWDFGDMETSSAVNPIHQYNVLDIYNVCLTTTNTGGSDTHCQEVNLLPSAVDDAMLMVKYTLSPNPASENILIEFSENLPAKSTLKIYDATGHTLLPNLIWENNKVFFDVHGFPSGIFFFHLKTMDGQNAVHGKFVVK